MKIPFEAHPNAIENIDRIANELLGEVQQLKFITKKNSELITGRPTPTMITGDDIIGDPVISDETEDGELGIAFFWEKKMAYGLKGLAVNRLDDLLSGLIKIKGIALAVSDDYLETEIFNWLKLRFQHDTLNSFWHCLTERLENDVQDIDVFVPIHGVTGESIVDLESVSLLGFSQQRFNQWEDTCVQNAPNQQQEIKALFSKMRRDMQGYVAVKVRVLAETNYAHKAAYEFAKRASDALRIFSPYRKSLLNRSFYGLLGTTISPISHTVSTGCEDLFSYQSSALGGTSSEWHIDNECQERMNEEGFDRAIKIAVTGANGDFQKYVWKSILAFSKSLSPVELEDRIAFRVAAIESILLKNNSEPIASSVGDRMAFLLSDHPETRREIVRNFKAVYNIRSDYVHHRKTRNEEHELEVFGHYAWEVMKRLILNVDNFETRDSFLESIERRRYGA